MYRNKFPYFRNDNPIYFDNASTTQKPDVVIDEVVNYLEKASNIGRSSYKLANQSTKKIDEVRSKVAQFIGAEKEEIIFTSGATQSLNMIPQIVKNKIKNNSKILVSEDSHKSTKLPWVKLKKQLKKQEKIDLIEYKVLKTGDPDIKDILSKIDKNTFLISLTHIHNAYGAKAEVKKLTKNLQEESVDPYISLDCCQSIGHVPIDVDSLNVDFLSFSGHKMFASTGSGVLYVDKDLHKNLDKHYEGGGMKRNTMPHKLERGTPNISSIISIGRAIDFIKNIGIEEIKKRNLELTKYLINGLNNLNAYFDKGVAYSSCKDVGYGIVSFNINKDGLSAKDLGFILDSNDIFVRDGGHCTVDSEEKETVRISLQFYNKKKEIDKLIKVVNNIS